MGDLGYSSKTGGARSGGGGLITGGTVTVELPAEVADLLQKEAKRHRKPIARYVAEWLEDQRDGREAFKRLRDIESGKVKTIPSAQVYRELGLK